MKHATDAALDEVERLLRQLRKLPEITERKRGVFYQKSRAALHFHEDPEGVFADVKVGDDWVRRRVATAEEQSNFLRFVRRIL